MTVAEIKKKTYAMIEELNLENTTNWTDDPDIASKSLSVINQIQNELSRIRTIPFMEEVTVVAGTPIEFSDLTKGCYQLTKVKGAPYELIGKTIVFEDDFAGTVTVYYNKYPEQLTSDTSALEIDADLQEIMPYGVAADLLKSDISADYGNVYANRYNELKNAIDPRRNTGAVYITEASLEG